MTKHCLPPLSATEFRSNVGWKAELYRDTQENQFSNFRFVEQFFYKKEHVNTVIRILSLARKLDFRSLLMEKLSEGDLKQRIDAGVSAVDCKFTSSEIYRLSFFSCPVTQAPDQEDFLGYAVIKADFYHKNPAEPHVYVYESVLASHRSEHARLERRMNFLHCKRNYTVENNFGKFSVTGAMYAQQNRRNIRCAHVALRSVLSLLTKDDISYDEINEIVGRPSHSRDGLPPAQISAVLVKRGVFSRLIDRERFLATKTPSFSRILYGCIESGCPALLTFYPRGDRIGHVVPVLGHTFDEDSWTPESRNSYFTVPKSKKQLKTPCFNGFEDDRESHNTYFPSEGWIDSFLIHDDNFGPYQTLPRNCFGEDDSIILWGLHTNSAALCFDRVETIALEVCQNFISKSAERYPSDFEWYDRFLHCSHENKLVLRSLFANKKHYIEHVSKNILEEKHLVVLRERLPDQFWIVEFSCRELFSATRAKFGEVLLSADKVNEKFIGEHKPLVLRLPGVIHFYPDNYTGETALSKRTPLFSQ